MGAEFIGPPVEPKRWFCIEQTLAGHGRFFVGRTYSTGRELRAALGPYADINPINGECHVWVAPPKAKRRPRLAA